MLSTSRSNWLELLSSFKKGRFQITLITATLTLLTFAVCAPPAALAGEEHYKLGAQDRVRIHVYEWPQLTGEFTIGAGGKIALPLLGQVMAGGLELPQLARVISERLKTKAKTLDLPDTSVSIVEYRPFYILGGVQQPGEYPFRPGMMALTALSIAGGIYRSPTETGWSILRDAIVGYADAQVFELKREELTAREIRLRAEAEGLDAIPASSSATPLFLEQELALFATRRAKRDDEIEALRGRSSLYSEELNTLQGQRDAIAKDRALVEGELKRIRALAERGLTTTAQSIVLERSLAQIERETLEIDTQALRAQQQISIAEQTIGTLRNDYKTDAVAELATVQAEFREIAPRLQAASRMVSDGSSMVATQASREDLDPLDSLQFEITRYDLEGLPQRIKASRTTRLQPGDILEVRNAPSRQAGNPNVESHSAITSTRKVQRLR